MIELQGVHKQFDGVHAVNGISLVVQEGEVLGLFGHNGAGKTTTMKLILGLLKPSSGTISVMGESPAENNKVIKRSLGYLPENVSFYPQLTGREVLYYFGKLKGVSKKQCDLLIERVGLGHACLRKVKTYSKGMKQRLGLAQALLGEPRLLLLDEPTGGLDPVATVDFYQVVDELKHKGCAVVLCSHVLPGVEKHISKAAILGKGCLVAYGALDELRDQARLPIRLNATFSQGRDQQFSVMESAIKSAQGDQPHFQVKKVNAQSIECAVSSENKLSVLKQLSAHDHLTDMEMHMPSLEQIYLHFNQSLFSSDERLKNTSTEGLRSH